MKVDRKVSVFVLALLITPPVFAQRGEPSQRPGETLDLVNGCVQAVRDDATGNCVGVSSVPTLGMLYPLSPDFEIFPDGRVSLSSTVGDARLAVGGDDYYGVFVPQGHTIGIQAWGQDFGVLGISPEWAGYFIGNTLVRRLFVGSGPPDPLVAELHLQESESAEILIEADTDDFDEMHQPSIRFSQDGGAVQAFIGCQDGDNHLALRNFYSGGGIRFDLHTSSNANWEFRRRSSTGTDVEARITRPGDLQLDGSVSSPAADLAEFYPVVGELEPGDVVAFAGQGLSLGRAQTGDASRLAGVISSRPAFTMGVSYSDEDELGVEPEPFEEGLRFQGDPSAYRVDGYVTHEIQVNRRAPLALAGRVPVKVTGENGPIRPGDLLTVSSVPGHAMLATGAGPVIGTALEAWEVGSGKILAFVNLGWHAPIDEITRLRADVERLDDELAAVLARLDAR